jgi:hypothetical protein
MTTHRAHKRLIAATRHFPWFFKLLDQQRQEAIATDWPASLYLPVDTLHPDVDPRFRELKACDSVTAVNFATAGIPLSAWRMTSGCATTAAPPRPLPPEEANSASTTHSPTPVTLVTPITPVTPVTRQGRYTLLELTPEPA